MPERIGPPGFLPGPFIPPPPFAPPEVSPWPPDVWPSGPGLARPAPIRPWPAAEAPRFAEVVPLAVTPTRLDRPVTEVPLPGPVETAAVAAGGRLLLLHSPKVGKVVVFDVSEGKVVRQIDAAEPGTLLAGGMNTFVIYQPKRNTFERWTCDKLERLPEVKSPFADPVRALAMGSASNGPLVAALGGSRGTGPLGASLGFFDPTAAREVGYLADGQPNPLGIGPAHSPVRLRVSANGGVVTADSLTRPMGAETTVIQDGRATRYWRQDGPPILAPSADGKYLGGFGKRFAPDRPEPRVPETAMSLFHLPAVTGPWYLTLTDTEPSGLPERLRPASVKVYHSERPGVVADLGRLDDVDFAGAHAGDIDQRVFLIPPARVLVTVAAPKRDRLVLRRVELK